jgi:hypothetical protein
MKRLDLTKAEVNRLVVFLKTLSSDPPVIAPGNVVASY